MKALDLNPSQDDKNSGIIHVKNDKPMSNPRASSRSKNAEGSSAKLPSTEQWDTSLPSAERNAESGALPTSHRQAFGIADNNITTLLRRDLDQLKWRSDVPVFFTEFDRLTLGLGITSHETRCAMVEQKLPPRMKQLLAEQALSFANYDTMRERFNCMWALDPSRGRVLKSRRRPKPKAQDIDKSWSMYPALHDSVCRLLEEDNLSFTFFAIDEDKGSIEDYDTNIMGRFKCLNIVCPKTGWASKLIAITIRMYSKQQYNARVYHQRCKGCGSLSQPFPDDSYAKRIAYRLKKWSGIEVDQPSYTVRGSERPHESALCEGCKHGHCKLSIGSLSYTRN